MRDGIEVRWNPSAEVFLVDFGNIHFSVTRTMALLLCDELRDAISRIRGPIPESMSIAERYGEIEIK